MSTVCNPQPNFKNPNRFAVTFLEVEFSIEKQRRGSHDDGKIGRISMMKINDINNSIRSINGENDIST